VAIPHLVPALSCGCKGVGENRALTSVIATMTACERRSLVEGIIGVAFRLPIRAILGETLDLCLPNRMMVALCVSLPLKGIVLGTVAGWWK
jgi:hypothetical protein